MGSQHLFVCAALPDHLHNYSDSTVRSFLSGFHPSVTDNVYSKFLCSAMQITVFWVMTPCSSTARFHPSVTDNVYSKFLCSVMQITVFWVMTPCSSTARFHSNVECRHTTLFTSQLTIICVFWFFLASFSNISSTEVTTRLSKSVKSLRHKLSSQVSICV